MKENSIVTVTEQIDSTQVKKLVAKMQVAVEKIDVTDEKKVTEAKEGIKKLKTLAKQQLAKYVDPAKQIIAEAKLQYEPWIDACDAAEKMLKDKVIEHVMAKRKEEEAEKQRLAARVEKGTMKVETAVKKMGEIEETKATQGGVTVRMIKDYTIEDESKIPDQYWVRSLNLSMIRAAVREGTEIPGIKVFEKPSGSF